MEYLIKFDENGNKISAAAPGINYETKDERQKFIDDGYLPFGVDAWQKFCGVFEGNDFVRYRYNKETKTLEKIIPEKIDKLFAEKDLQYKTDVDFLVKAWTIAELANDNNLKSMLRKNYAEITREYQGGGE